MSQSDAYGSRFWPVFLANRRDRRQGLGQRAAARNGYVRPPRGEGRIVWIKAGNSRDSVRLACEVLGAIRQRRYDIRLVMTFENDYAEIIEPRVRGLRKIGLGFGPCDRSRALERVWEIWQPLGIVAVDTPLGAGLLKQAERHRTHVMAFQVATPSTSVVEAAYPCNRQSVAMWSQSQMAKFVSEPADTLAQFVEAQADVTLRSLARGDRDDLGIWWWYGSESSQSEMIAAWRKSDLSREGVLFVSGPEGICESSVDLSLREWDRSPLHPGQVLGLDQLKWLPALASAMNAGHMQIVDRHVFWSALAGASPLSVGRPPEGIDDWEMLPLLKEVSSVLNYWRQMNQDSVSSRKSGDLVRQRLWAERHRIQSMMNDLINRVFDW